MKQILFICLVAIQFAACQHKNDYQTLFKDPLLYTHTVHELNRVVMGNNFSPIVASRNYTYANIAAYEVIAAGYPDQFSSLAGQVKGLSRVPKAPKGAPINYELASLLAFCTLGESVTFPKGSMDEYIDSLQNLAKDHGMPAEEYRQSVAFADTLKKGVKGIGS